MTGYAVRAADPAAVADDVARVWRDNLSLSMDASARFAWVYRDAPAAPASVLVLEEQPGRVVGTAGVAERRVQVGDVLRSAGHLVDLAVDAPHRSLGPALALVRAARRRALAEHDLAYGFPNAKARGLFQRVGYRAVGPVTRWARVLRHRRYVERYAGAHAGSVLAGAFLDRALWAWSAPARAAAGLRYRLERVERPDARFDALFERARREYDIVGERSAEVLRWRFSGGRYALFALLSRAEPGRIRAHAVVERQGATAHLRDLFGERAALGALLDLLLPRLRRDGAASVSFMCLAPAPLRALLRSRGFRPREAERLLFADTASNGLTLWPAERWYVTDFDDDA